MEPYSHAQGAECEGFDRSLHRLHSMMTALALRRSLHATRSLRSLRRFRGEESRVDLLEPVRPRLDAVCRRPAASKVIRMARFFSCSAGISTAIFRRREHANRSSQPDNPSDRVADYTAADPE